jgi:predicted RND superfamily exporter protein
MQEQIDDLKVDLRWKAAPTTIDFQNPPYKGRAILSSSLILCIGFGVLVLSRFVPTINFGMLSAIIMITAVIGDLVVLPSIILLKPDRGSHT